MSEERVAGDLLTLPGDVVVQRGDHQYVVRCIKRYQEFLPRPLLDSLNPIDILFTMHFSVLRKIPASMTSQWQAGVVRVPLKSGRAKVLEKQKFPAQAEAEAQRDQLERRVRNGDFDSHA